VRWKGRDEEGGRAGSAAPVEASSQNHASFLFLPDGLEMKQLAGKAYDYMNAHTMTFYVLLLLRVECPCRSSTRNLPMRA
jgi:hypothetical protein